MERLIVLLAVLIAMTPAASQSADIKLFDEQYLFPTFTPIWFDSRNTFDNWGRIGVRSLELTCFPGDAASIVTPYDTGVIVDNFMTVNDATGLDPIGNVCDQGDVPGATACIGTECYAGFSNCFVSGSAGTTGVPIEDIFVGIGDIELIVGGPSANIPLGTNTNTFRLWDWGAVAGNTELRLVTTCEEGGVPLDAKPGSNPNAVNLCKNGGVVPVAFVGTEAIDYSQYSIVGVSLVAGDPSSMVAGNGKSDVCHLEDVVDESDPSEHVSDGFVDVVCQIPVVDFADGVDVADSTVTAYLYLDDGFDQFVVTGTSELTIVRSCED